MLLPLNFVFYYRESPGAYSMNTCKKIKVLFEVVQEYYWPAMEPIYRVMAADPRYELAVRIGPNHRRFFGALLLPQCAAALARDKEYIYSSTDGKSSQRVKEAIEELLEGQ